MTKAHQLPFAQRPLAKRMIRIMILACVCALGISAGWAQQPLEKSSSSLSAGGAPQVSPGSNEQYRIGSGDELSIAIFGKTQLSRDERVDARGMIRMPLIDEDIRASCRTEDELAEEIARMYRDRQLLRNPSVTVSVKEFQSQPVAVMGFVNSPGRFILRRRVRLLELLVFHAGGPNLKAGRKIQILSTAPVVSCEGSTIQNAATDATTAISEDSVVSYDLNELLQGNETMNPYVHQGDIINVPAAEEVIVVGNVAHPSAIPLLEPTTLARAIAMAGGTLANTKKDKIRVKRQIPGRVATTEFLVDLNDKDKSNGADFLLQGGDIVEVSTKTGLSIILANLYKNIVPGLQSLPMRVIY